MKKSLNNAILALALLALSASFVHAGDPFNSPAMKGIPQLSDISRIAPCPSPKIQSEEYVLEEFIRYLWDDGNWVENLRMYRDFEGISNIKTETYQFWNGSSWINAQRQNNEYNEHNQLYLIVWMQWIMSSWSIYLNTDITYNENGLIDHAHSHFGANPEILESFTYDEDLLITYLYQTRPDWIADYENVNRRLYSYTDTKQYDEIIFQDWGESDWENESKWKFLYDSESRITERIEYKYYANDWQPDIRYLIYYDTEGLNNYVLEQTYGGSDWTDAAREFYYYNENRTLARAEREIVDPIDDWVFELKTEYEYKSYMTDIIPSEENLPGDFVLFQNYPNPFNMSTKIEFSIPSRGDVSLDIYNILGQKIISLVDEELPAGFHSVLWDGYDRDGKVVPTGVYFCNLKTATESRAQKMVLIK